MNITDSRTGLPSLLTFVAMIGLIAVSSNAVKADDWPQFLGPNRNGVSAESDLLEEWPAQGPPIVWEAKLGEGMSGIAIVSDIAYTMYQDTESQYVVAIDADGNQLWETSVAPHYRNQMGSGPRATPTVEAGRVFAYTGEGILVALNAIDGDIIWSLDAVSDVDGRPADYGMASSPLVVEDVVVVTTGSSTATLAGFDVATGDRLWTVGSDRAGYSSAALLEVGGESQIVAFTGNSVIGVSPTEGTQRWRYPFETDYDCNTATPLSIHGMVFVSAGENHGSVVLEISGDSERQTANAVWESLGRESVMRNEWQTAIVWDGYLYGLDNVGSAGAVTHLNCLNLADGERVWQEVRFGKSNLIAADGKLFVSTMEGELVVVSISPAGYEEMGRMPVLGSTRQAPSLSNGFLYFRDNEKMVKVDVRQ